MSSQHAPLTDHRLHLPADTRPVPGREFVLYWMQTTHRAHDNFGLNFAIEQADALGLPVLVYHGLRHDYPWASDRFHTWILQSVADIAAGLEARGIQYAFWLSRSRGAFTEWPAGRREDGAEKESPDDMPLVPLADRAALVVTDYLPTFIVPRQVRGLRRRTATPVIAVDSATLVPMAYHTKEQSTARGMRTVLMGALEHFLWPVANPAPKLRRRVELPESAGWVDLAPLSPRTPAAAEAIARLVAACDVDHAVPPSPMFRGGTAAGRARLDRFLARGLPRYEEDRNDPNEPEAVSRLSPWLHFGNLSIHEVLLAAREAGPADQYAKFLDEALVWREVAHNFCHFNPKHRTVAGIPQWAREQLAAHESDPRPALYSLEELEQARTGEALWNAAQRSYLRDGWMHNYMRMLWGKSVLMWTRNATECLAVLEHLNNKYSLDGRDPNSYGGVMWTFGKYDRPFYRRPIFGTVRYQSLNAAKGKFDVPRYIRTFE
jgi:deoxyribodipyrimidine photo-lyase